MFNFITGLKYRSIDLYKPNTLLNMPYDVVNATEVACNVHWTCEFDIRKHSIQGCVLNVSKITNIIINWDLDLGEIRHLLPDQELARFEDMDDDRDDIVQGQISIQEIVDGKDGWNIDVVKNGFDRYPTINPLLATIDFGNKQVSVTFES